MLRPPGSKPEFCEPHSTKGLHENVVLRRCGSCSLPPFKFAHPLSKVAQCTECDPTLSRSTKKKEEAVAAAILAAGGLAFRREFFVPFAACGLGVNRAACAQQPSINARLDFVLVSDSAVVVIEVDEAQHAHYCVGGEISRVNEVFESL